MREKQGNSQGSCEHITIGRGKEVENDSRGSREHKTAGEIYKDIVERDG